MNQDGLNGGAADKKIVSYFSGTANHSADLVAHLDAISDATSASDDFEVHVYGQLKLNRELPGNWKRLAPVAFHQLPQLIRQSWICIAPIVDNPFNRCKSAIKFLESASFGKPLITQPLPEFARLNAPGLMLVESDWRDAFRQLRDTREYHNAATAAVDFVDGHLVGHQMREMSQWL